MNMIMNAGPFIIMNNTPKKEKEKNEEKWEEKRVLFFSFF